MVLAAMDPSIRCLMADLRFGVLIPKNNETIQIQRYRAMKSWLTNEVQQEKPTTLKKYNPKLGKVCKIN